MKTIINNKPCKVHLEDELERLKGYWGIWTCNLEFDDGSTPLVGTIQTDGHMCAPETFEDQGTL